METEDGTGTSAAAAAAADNLMVTKKDVVNPYIYIYIYTHKHD